MKIKSIFKFHFKKYSDLTKYSDKYIIFSETGEQEVIFKLTKDEIQSSFLEELQNSLDISYGLKMNDKIVYDNNIILNEINCLGNPIDNKFHLDFVNQESHKHFLFLKHIDEHSIFSEISKKYLLNSESKLVSENNSIIDEDIAYNDFLLTKNKYIKIYSELIIHFKGIIEDLEKNIDARASRPTKIYFIIGVINFIVLFYLTFFLWDWNVVEPISYMIFSATSIIALFGYIRFRKNIDIEFFKMIKTKDLEAKLKNYSRALQYLEKQKQSFNYWAKIN